MHACAGTCELCDAEEDMGIRSPHILALRMLYTSVSAHDDGTVRRRVCSGCTRWYAS